MKSKSRRRDDSNFILQSYCAFFFHFSPSFCWVFLAYSDLHRHYDFKIKLPKLQKKKKIISCFCPVSIYRPKQLDFAGMADSANIFFDMKHGVYLYRCTGRHSIYRSYRPVRHQIDFLAF